MSPTSLIIKSASLMYLMDFDGTLVGSDNWGGFLNNTKLCFRRRHFNPDDLDIRWSILTARPKMDRFLIKLVCGYHGMHPNQIFTGPTFRYTFKNHAEEAKYKEGIIKKILDDKMKVDYTDEKVDKILYIDNNEKITIPLNQNRGDYRYIAISVSDFITKNFYEVVL
jgi:hypothetical protein